MEHHKTIHVVLIDYFKAYRVVDSIKSLRDQSYSQADIYITVIDNSCSDENFEILHSLSDHQVKVLRTQKNIGYIAAVNMAVHSESRPTDFILLLNPDIIIEDPNTLSGIIKNFEDPKCYVVGPAQINDDGSRPTIARGYPSVSALVAKRTFLKYTSWGKKKISEYLLSDFNPGKKQKVPWLQSSCVFIRRSYWEQVKGLNPKYFLFMADIEVCEKAYEHGGYVLYDPSHTALADGKRCSEGGAMSLFTSHALRMHVIDAYKYYTG